MEMPNNYANTQAMGDYKPIELGGHHLKIMQVVEMKNKFGGQMVKVCFDTAENDRQPRYFLDMYNNDKRQDRKWPNNGTQYINVLDSDGKCSRQFKTFTTCVEESNPGFQVQWGENFAACFKGRSVGGVFGIVQEEYNGKRTKRHRLRWFAKTDGVLDAAVPEPKLLDDALSSTSSYGTGSDSAFMNVPEEIDEDMPFT